MKLNSKIVAAIAWAFITIASINAVLRLGYNFGFALLALLLVCSLSGYLINARNNSSLKTSFIYIISCLILQLIYYSQVLLDRYYYPHWGYVILGICIIYVMMFFIMRKMNHERE